MTRLDAILARHHEPIRHHIDIYQLKQEIPELCDLSYGVIQDLYSNWSEEYYSAGWMMLDEKTVEEFAAYLRTEVEG